MARFISAQRVDIPDFLGVQLTANVFEFLLLAFDNGFEFRYPLLDFGRLGGFLGIRRSVSRILPEIVFSYQPSAFRIGVSSGSLAIRFDITE